jgi:Domain of unknown function (DUF1707)/Domain of unknown function (DUF4190)
MTIEPGHDPAARGYGHLRAASADRERAIDVLKAAFAEGRLDRDEFDDRIGQVHQSRTYAELAALTADLPVGPLGAMTTHPAPVPAVPSRQPLNTLAVTSLVCAFIPGIPWFAAVITGLIARKQIRETGERGDGMAAAGILISAFFLLAAFLYLAA